MKITFWFFMVNGFLCHVINRDDIAKLTLKAAWAPAIAILGPRQCGKTFLAKEILKTLNSSSNYFNYDSQEDKKRILAQQWSEEKFIALDEIHKYPKWKTFVK
jgi:predicted AAA+ superfamily ATPase